MFVDNMISEFQKCSLNASTIEKKCKKNADHYIPQEPSSSLCDFPQSSFIKDTNVQNTSINNKTYMPPGLKQSPSKSWEKSQNTKPTLPVSSVPPGISLKKADSGIMSSTNHGLLRDSTERIERSSVDNEDDVLAEIQVDLHDGNEKIIKVYKDTDVFEVCDKMILNNTRVNYEYLYKICRRLHLIQRQAIKNAQNSFRC